MRTFGYTNSGAVIEEEAAVLRRAAEQLLGDDKKSLREVAGALRQDNVVTAAGKVVTPLGLRRMLLNPKIAGLRRNDAGETVKAEWPEIIPPETYDRLVALLADPSRKRGPGYRVRPYLLAGGLMRCGLCDMPLESSPTEFRKRSYRCSGSKGCGRIRIRAQGIEDDVAERVLARLASPATRDRLKAAATAGINGSVSQRITLAKEKLAANARQYALSEIDSTSFRVILKSLNDQIKELEGERRRLQQLADLPSFSNVRALAEWWHAEETTVERRRALVGVFLDHAVIGKTTRPGSAEFDPARVTYVWR